MLLAFCSDPPAASMACTCSCAVAATAQEQVQAIESVDGSLQKASSISRQSSHCAQQISGAVEELVKISGQLNELLSQHRSSAAAPVKVARVSDVVASAQGTEH